MHRQTSKIWRFPQSTYLCTVFFIVLDLRLTKDWLSGIDSLFCWYMSDYYFSTLFHSLSIITYPHLLQLCKKVGNGAVV